MLYLAGPALGPSAGAMLGESNVLKNFMKHVFVGGSSAMVDGYVSGYVSGGKDEAYERAKYGALSGSFFAGVGGIATNFIGNKIAPPEFKGYNKDFDSVKPGTEGVSNPNNVSKIGESALNHSSVGDFTYNPKTGKVSKMKGGGHGQANIDFLEKNGLKYEIVDTYPNGVRVGNVADHKVKGKRTGTNQSWFPESWSENDIVNAGEYVGNLKENINAVDGVISYGEVNGVRVGVIRTDGKISTIFPDATMQP